MGEKKKKLMLYSTQLELKLKLELSLAIFFWFVEKCIVISGGPYVIGLIQSVTWHVT